jgi:hypothetical protein
MGVNNRGYKPLSKLKKSRSGTAEIVGAVMFLVILLFFFSNVFLWHNQATREMDSVILDRVNSHVSIEIVNVTLGSFILQVTNNGGVGFSLSRLWIITQDDHNYAHFEEDTIWISGGDKLNITLISPTQYESDGSYLVNGLSVYYEPYANTTTIFKILTTLGNTAAVKYYS